MEKKWLKFIRGFIEFCAIDPTDLYRNSEKFLLETSKVCGAETSCEQTLPRLLVANILLDNFMHCFLGLYWIQKSRTCVH